MIPTLAHLNAVFTRVCECPRKLRLTNWCVQAFLLFQKWHHLSSGWPETTHNSNAWLSYFRMGEFSSQIGVKIAQPPNTEVFLPLSFAAAGSGPCACAGCLSHGWVVVWHHTWRAWLFCRCPLGSSHRPGRPISSELPSWSHKMLCVNKQTCVWMKKKTEISLTLLVWCP